jgi:hypothetical protein
MLQEVEAQHARLYALPFALFEQVATRHGVAARSLETRYGQHVSALAARSQWSLSADAAVMLAGEGDFSAAYQRLAQLGPVPAFPVFERVLWADVSRALVGLRVGERRRRQRLAEARPGESLTAALPAAA